MKKKVKYVIVSLCVAALLAGCGQSATTPESDGQQVTVKDTVAKEAVNIVLADSGITVDGETATTDSSAAVYAAKDIVYYEAGKDFTYGEGMEKDEHTKEEADAHTVVHITKPGTYAVSGKLSAGQIAVDLGEEAKKDPDAVVTLVLNGVDIQCSVAPAVIFYNVYECGSKDAETATKDVDTSAAGANVVIADGTLNNVAGSYVARIYKSVELNEDGTEVVDSKKLHKYDAAFYSKMTMNVNGETEGNGVLNITAENEGLDSELHLTINGGIVNITSGNDGINTNEDSVSVTTINGGELNITVDGSTGEGDGIDSNGWLVINGGTVNAFACDKSMDAGIDSDMGIHINGGTVVATGNMLDHIAESKQNYAVFSFAGQQEGGKSFSFKQENDEAVAETTPINGFSYLILSTSDMTEGTYTFWNGETQLAGAAGGNMMPGGFGMPPMQGGFDGEFPEGMEMPEGMIPPQGMEMPEGMMPPEGAKMPEINMPQNGAEMPPITKDGVVWELPEEKEMPEGMEFPEGMMPPRGMECPQGGRGEMESGERSTSFVITNGGNRFSNVAPVE